MSELLVLGLIPGTQIQITFLLWLLSMSLISVALLMWSFRRRHAVRNLFIAYRLHALVRSIELRHT